MTIHHRLFQSPIFVTTLVLAVLVPGCSHRASSGFEGYVEGKFVYVASPQGGRLDELSISRGDVVAANHPLFTLDREPEAAAAQQAEKFSRPTKPVLPISRPASARQKLRSLALNWLRPRRKSRSRLTC